jgi:hypothetical protein
LRDWFIEVGRPIRIEGIVGVVILHIGRVPIDVLICFEGVIIHIKNININKSMYLPE